MSTPDAVRPNKYAANREAIRQEIEAHPADTNTAIAKRMQTSRDTVISVRKQLAGLAITSRYDSMCRAIAECAAVDEVKDMRDKAMALEVYARQAQNFEAERTAQEIRVRAEKQAGRLLGDMPKAKGGGDRKSTEYHTSSQSRGDVADADSLRARGISYNQSSQWQELAKVPEETFEAAIADKTEPLSATRIIERHKAITQPPVEPAPAEPVQKVDKRAMHLWAQLRDLTAWLEANDVKEIMPVMPYYLLDDVLDHAPRVVAQLTKIGV